jgi:hypothetical protein
MKTSIRTNIFWSLILIFAFASCSPMRETSPDSIATPSQLPFNDTNFEEEYCQSPKVVLPHADAEGLDENEIAGKLMEQWLSYFNAPQAPDYCRIDGYRVDEVFYDERTPDLPLEPKGDFIRTVRFSILLVQMPNYWMSWAGEIDQQNWLHAGHNIAVFRTDEGYSFEFANP